MNEINNTSDFYKWFETISSKLGNREVSFKKIFKYLDSQPDPIIIVETGCLRVKDNFLDGQSTLLFDKYTLSRKKGSKVYIEGQLQTRKWEQDGQTRYTTEVIGRDMQFLDSRGSSNSDNSSYENTNQDMGSQNLPDSGITDDDIPF